MSRTRQLLGRRPFHFAALGREGESISIAGEGKFAFTHDSEQPVVSDEEKEAENTGKFCLIFFLFYNISFKKNCCFVIIQAKLRQLLASNIFCVKKCSGMADE